MNSANPTTQTYSGAHRSLPMNETPNGEMSATAMATVIRGLSPPEFKTSRALQVIFDQQVEIGLQRTSPDSIVRVGGRSSRQRPAQTVPIEEVDPITIMFADIGQDEEIPPERSIQDEQQKQEELDDSLRRFLQVDTTEVPKCISCQITSTKGTCLICGRPLCPKCTHVCPTCAIQSCSGCARDHWPQCRDVVSQQGTAITDKDKELDEDEPPAKRLDSTPLALPDVIQDDSTDPPLPPKGGTTKHKTKSRESPKVKKTNTFGKQTKKSPRRSSSASSREGVSSSDYTQAVNNADWLMGEHGKVAELLEQEEERTSQLSEQVQAQAQTIGTAQQQLSDKNDAIAELKRALEESRRENEEKEQRLQDLRQNNESLSGIALESENTIERQKHEAQALSNQFARELRASQETISQQEATTVQLIDEIAQGRQDATEVMDRARSTNLLLQQQDQAAMRNAEEVSYLTNELQNRAHAMAEMRTMVLSTEDQSQQIAKSSAIRELELKAEVQSHIEAAASTSTGKRTNELLRQQQSEFMQRENMMREELETIRRKYQNAESERQTLEKRLSGPLVRTTLASATTPRHNPS